MLVYTTKIISVTKRKMIEVGMAVTRKYSYDKYLKSINI